MPQAVVDTLTLMRPLLVREYTDGVLGWLELMPGEAYDTALAMLLLKHNVLSAEGGYTGPTPFGMETMVIKYAPDSVPLIVDNQLGIIGIRANYYLDQQMEEQP